MDRSLLNARRLWIVVKVLMRGELLEEAKTHCHPAFPAQSRQALEAREQVLVEEKFLRAAIRFLGMA